ncbi:hypothetical protein DRW42_13740 [Pedobacter miscanthi]|uniref:Uncharacterized protein n=1 Tax=Pedobacter miscanthi TaxID=2259170 RepID=A0A366L0J5_9SPHI|nr:hypothetical protein DRW42_13740 [Pedobacter miscanthi]
MAPDNVQVLPKQKEERNKWPGGQRPQERLCRKFLCVPELNLKFVTELNKNKPNLKKHRPLSSLKKPNPPTK